MYPQFQGEQPQAYPQGYPQQTYQQVYPGQPAPAGYNMQGPPPGPPMTQPLGGLAALSNLSSVWVHQEAQYLEGCGCEFENEYTVYGVKEDGGELKRDKTKLLFECKERSSCCQRYCCSSSMRGFDMDVKFNTAILDPYKQSGTNLAPFLHLKREYRCTCCCCNRPCIETTLIEGGKNETIGYVTDCWSLCNYVYDIRGVADQDTAYVIEGSCCQCGLCCKCPCGPCKKVDFGVFDSKGKTQLGNISKVWTGLARTLLTDADSYVVTFPADMTPNYKVLLIVSAILIDYSHFEESPADEANNNQNNKS